MGPDQEVVFEGEKIILDIPEDGLELESGWTITPHTHPGVIHMLLCLEGCILGLHCLYFSCYIGCSVVIIESESSYFIYTDYKTAGRPICSRATSALLPVVCEVDRAAGATCGAGAQGEAAGSKRTLQLLPDSTSCITAITSRFILIM